MAPPTRHAIATLRSITGADEDEAVRLLEVHDGNLTEAVDAHLNKGDKKPVAASSLQSHSDLMDLDDPIDAESSDSPRSRFSASRRVTEVPIAVDVAGSAANQGSGFHMIATDKGMVFLKKTDKGMLVLSNPYHGIDDFSDGEEEIDIEEEMIKAAIEASKREDGGSVLDSSPGLVIDQMSHDFENELACAVSLSMKVAEQEKIPHELGVQVAERSSIPEERQRATTQVSQNDSDKNSSLYRLPPHLPSSSLTAQRLLREEQDEAYLEALEADKEKEMKEAQTALEKERHQEEENCRKLLEEEECKRILAAKEASLPHEPSPDNENVVTLLVRMPDGSRRGRRFMQSDKLQLLFDYIDIGRVVKPGSYRLVRPYPRCAFTVEDHASLTLYELGLTRNEAFYLEQI